MRASENGHEGTVQLLLERDDIQLDATNKYGRTAYSYSVRYGNIARMILDRRSRQTSA
ncbi:hypothetical protein BKA70DRAFT_1279931 [Coprinopsis sp. MPI-PUGE-AT-0042]|nr:hypothetical protein BKA70DRAFT_1279931 [Coprinopsis sp. MPI-PUGE-AT-0042]